MNPKVILEKAISLNSLSTDESRFFLESVMKGEVSEILFSSFLTAMKIKGVNAKELTGFASALRSTCVQTKGEKPKQILDTCGTGGDGLGTMNISTLSALTLASLGVSVAKHGNRAVSSISGSSDLLSQLGYPLDLTHEETEKRLLKTNFTFAFAPAWHPSMKFAAPVRKELGFRTFMNLVGPLSNPFFPTHQVIGVYDGNLISIVAQTLQNLGIERGIVCHSMDGMDEFSVFAKTQYVEITTKERIEKVFDPASLGLPKVDLQEILISSPGDALVMAKKLISGEPFTGTEIVALNAGVGLYLVGACQSIEEGYKTAKTGILQKNLEKYFSKEFVF